MKRSGAILLGFAAAALLAAGYSGMGRAKISGSVLLVLSTDCPVAMKYTPRIQSLYSRYSSQGIEFKAIFPNDLETRRGIDQYRKERGFDFACELDLGAERAKKEGVKTLPAILVFDSNGRKVYEGAIDDNKDVALVSERYAEQALDAVLSGRKPSKSKTKPFGCVLMPGDSIPVEGKATYADHVAPILFKHCAECHRPGEVAPFSLLTYEEAKKWAPMIAQVTDKRRMPPWKAVQGFGEFKDENVLTEAEIETLRRWAASGAPQGDSAKAPKPPAAASEWPQGKPDLVLEPGSEYKLEAEGADVYRHYVLKTDFKETRYVKGMWVKPGNARVVHHVIAFLDERGASHSRDGQDGQPGYSTNGGGPGFIPEGSFGGWAPGLRAQQAPPGVAFELKPGATIVLQVHYHKSGKPEIDRTKIGLYFAKEPVEKVMSLAWLANPFFRIPAGAESHKVEFSFPIPADLTMYSVMPHMHLLGRSMKAEALLPDGTKKPLIFVEDWDFNWQLNYMFKEPVQLPAGSKVHVEAYYDNSSKNPYNPNKPPKPITWGEQTTDEMFLLVASYTLDGTRSAKSRRLGFGGG